MKKISYLVKWVDNKLSKNYDNLAHNTTAVDVSIHEDWSAELKHVAISKATCDKTGMPEDELDIVAIYRM